MFDVKESSKLSHNFAAISMNVENTAESLWRFLGGKITLILILSRKVCVCVVGASVI